MANEKLRGSNAVRWSDGLAVNFQQPTMRNIKKDSFGIELVLGNDAPEPFDFPLKDCFNPSKRWRRGQSKDHGDTGIVFQGLFLLVASKNGINSFNTSVQSQTCMSL